MWDGCKTGSKGLAQPPTLAIWGTYLQQCSILSNSLLSGYLQCLSGPVTYTSGKQEELAFEPLVGESPCQEGKPPIPEGGSSHEHPLKWRAVAFHLRLRQ